MPKDPDVVSLAKIAEAAGVSRMTVSLALRNSTRISTETKDRVHKIAKALKYKPDARITEHMVKVRASKHRSLMPIAWLDMNEDYGKWNTLDAINPYLDGASELCEKMGYQLQNFWLREPGMSVRRMSQILYSRGIQGVIAAPSSQHCLTYLRFQWDRFACVSFERGLEVPLLNRAVSDLYYNLMLALKVISRAGYKRIGIVYPNQLAVRSYHTIEAGALLYQSQLKRSERVPPLLHRNRGVAEEGFIKWMKKYRPEVVGLAHQLVDWVQEAGFSVPDEVGVVHLAVDNDCLDWAGIYSRKRQIGAMAANILIHQIQTHSFGIPEVPMETFVRGCW
ncbi:LacI family DNA-binding transcriptional regulator [Ruficoccus sp. ZRK36]|uniref:LacI family DNA-binding transcriptional regulator n=1 Tax=Ruficoccus sp. ZRK36 TaxID=2866311 RepID=UPI001C73AC74|nr:LacI family DNA-binding transcriptional regulator [Ruficoccus sp. ZRK36]QYY37282.1 LacI family transcriptional regulator [Ruficoccus sp. ZRK36]